MRGWGGLKRERALNSTIVPARYCQLLWTELMTERSKKTSSKWVPYDSYKSWFMISRSGCPTVPSKSDRTTRVTKWNRLTQCACTDLTSNHQMYHIVCQKGSYKFCIGSSNYIIRSPFYPSPVVFCPVQKWSHASHNEFSYEFSTMSKTSHLSVSSHCRRTHMRIWEIYFH